MPPRTGGVPLYELFLSIDFFLIQGILALRKQSNVTFIIFNKFVMLEYEICYKVSVCFTGMMYCKVPEFNYNNYFAFVKMGYNHKMSY